MTKTGASAVLAVVALLVQPALAASRQDRAPAAPAARPQDEADNKLDQILSGGRDRPARIAQLEQFIHDYPNYPELDVAYMSLLMALSSPTVADPPKVLAVADVVLAKFPANVSMRTTAYRMKLTVLRREADIRALAQKLLDAETDPGILRMAAQMDEADSVKLLEKALAERAKIAEPARAAAFENLDWLHVEALYRAGRSDEAIMRAPAIIERTRARQPNGEAPAADNRARAQRLAQRRLLVTRSETLARWYRDAGDAERALAYLNLAQQSSDDDAREITAHYEPLRAAIYVRAGKRDLALESYVQAFAASMDVETRDRIRDLAALTGAKPQELFDRARAIRVKNATAIKAFELKTPDGGTIALDSLQAKAIVLNFFFPT